MKIQRSVVGFTALAAGFALATPTVAQDYPPYGPNVPKAHFDHGKRPQVTPPAPNLLPDGRTAESAWNMQLVGYDSLDGRSTYQPLVVDQVFADGSHHWIAYMAHHAGCAVSRLSKQTEVNGTSVLDVTDPKSPVYLYHIQGFGAGSPNACSGSLDAGGNQMAHVCSGDSLPSSSPAEASNKHGRYFLLRTNGNSSGSANPGTESHEIWDVTNPSSPTMISSLDTQATNTHKDWWDCSSGMAYLVTNDSSAASPRPDLAPGWHQSGSNQHVKIYNLHDPTNPEYVRDFGFVGQQPTVGTTIEGLVTPPTGIHGPIAAGNRVYMAFGVGGNGVVGIYDTNTLLNGCNGKAGCAQSPSEADMLAPQKGWFTLPGTTLQGGHTSFPIFGEEDGKPRNIVLVTSEEGGNECAKNSAPHAAWLYDVTNEASPTLISQNPNDPARTLLDVPNGFDYSWIGIVSGNGAADTHCGTDNCSAAGVYGTNVTPTDPTPQPNNFCNQGARFGAHASTELFYPPYYGRLAIVSWFTGGVRVFDIRNPDNARPIAYFIPAPNDTGCGPGGGPSPGPGCTFASTGRNGHTVNAIHTNNVEVDDRGYIYIADRDGTGMHILRLTGEAAGAAIGNVPANH